MFAFDGHDGNRQDRSDVCRPVRLSREVLIQGDAVE